MSTVLMLWTTILLKSTIVVCVAWLGALLLHRSSSASRYVVWSITLIALALLPLIAMVVPAWNIGLIPDSAPVSAAGRVASPMMNVEAGPAARQIGEAPPAVNGEGSPLESTEWNSLISPATIITTFWFCGTLVLLLRFMVLSLKIRIVTRRGAVECPQTLRRMVRDLRTRLNIDRHVEVILSEQASAPFSWGAFRPAVILPATVTEWSVERQRSVLLHEMAHIARLDYPLHVLAEIVGALYWPNPLVWIAIRRCADERERACDDSALHNGTHSTDYATHLLEIARLQVERFSLAGATSMAGEPGLKGRICHVLNKQQDRSPVNPFAFFIVCYFALIMILPLAAANLTESEWVIPSTGSMMSDLEQSPNKEGRRRAAWWLGEHESRRAVQPLIESLDDPSAEVRQAAAWALGEIKDHQAIEPLIRSLDDHDPLVREMAVLSLGEIEDPSAVGPLVRTFDEEADLRIAVIWALGEIEGRGSDEARTARRLAFDRLGRQPWSNHQVWAGRLDRNDADRIRSNARDFEDLYRLLDSESATDRREAVLAIGLLAKEHPFVTTDDVVRTVDLLLDTLQDPIPEVRAAAVWSLDEVNPSRARSGSGLLR